MRYLFIIILSLFIFSCRTSKNSANAGSPQEAVLVISMKKTACYGTCPVYELQIYSDLTVKLKGERYVDYIGDYVSAISEDRLNGFKESFENAGFFALEDEYTGNVTDLPATYVFYDNGAQSKKVMDYYNPPQSLKDLEKDLEKLLDELDWAKVEE